MSKCYQIESSPLYRLRNRRKLAELLNLPKNYFRESHTYCYNEFSRPKPNGDGERHFTVPSEDLKDIYGYVHSYDQELKKLSRNRFYKAKRKKVLSRSKQIHKVGIEMKH